MKKLIVVLTLLLLTGCHFLDQELVSDSGFNIDLDDITQIDVYKDWAYETGIYEKTTLENSREHVMIDFLNSIEMKQHSENVDAIGSYYSVVIDFDGLKSLRVDFLDLKRGVIQVNDVTYILLENDLSYIKTIEFDGLTFEDENIEALFDYLNLDNEYRYTQIARFEMDNDYYIYRIPNIDKETCRTQVEFFIEDHFYSGVKGCTNNFESFDFYAAKDGEIYDLKELLENGTLDLEDFHRRIYVKYLFDNH